MESDSESPAESWWPEEIEGHAAAGILWRIRPGLDKWLLFGEALLRLVRARHARSQAAFLELVRRDMAAIHLARRQLRAGQLQLQ